MSNRPYKSYKGLKKLRVAITSGYNASKHGIALLHEISALPHVEVVLLLQVKTFTIKRLKQLIRMYGWRDALEKFKNIFLSSKSNRFVEEVMPMKNFLRERKIKSTTTKQACRKLKIKVKLVQNLNEKVSIDCIKQNKVDLIVYSGGGILRSNLIQSTQYGILNAHSGPLPFFRGMNCLEWSLFYNVKPEVTVHFIDGGIDTGPILKRFPWDVTPGDTISLLRGKSAVREVVSLLDVVSNFEKYNENKHDQGISQGLQFFTMHPFLREIIDNRLSQGWLPSLSYDEFNKIKNPT